MEKARLQSKTGRNSGIWMGFGFNIIILILSITINGIIVAISVSGHENKAFTIFMISIGIYIGGLFIGVKNSAKEAKKDFIFNFSLNVLEDIEKEKQAETEKLQSRKVIDEVAVTRMNNKGLFRRILNMFGL